MSAGRGHGQDLVDELERAVADAQRAGAKQVRERVTNIAGGEIAGPSFRWVEVETPAVVYFPDAHRSRSWAGIAMTVLFLTAFLAGVLAIVSATESDWLFVGIFGVATVVLGGAGVWVDVADTRRRDAARRGVETRGLYLTPDAVVIRNRRRDVAVPRAQVVRFGVRRLSDADRTSARHRVFVEITGDDGRAVVVDLKDGTDRHLVEACRAWHEGHWPIPLPR